MLGLGAGPAAADGETIFGFLRNGDVPVAGAEVTVTGGRRVHRARVSATTRGAGTSRCPRTAPTPCPSTTRRCPRVSSSATSRAKSLKVEVAFGQNKPVLFPLGESTRKVASKWERGRAAHRRGSPVRPDHRAGRRRAVPDLRHDRADELRARRARHLRRAARPICLNSGNLPASCLSGRTLSFIVRGIALALAPDRLGQRRRACGRPLRRRGTGLIAMMIVSIGLSILRALRASCTSSAAAHESYPAYRGSGRARRRPDHAGRQGLHQHGASPSSC